MHRLVVLIALCATTAARAETRAWTAAKKVLPAKLDLIGGSNLTTARSSKLFDELWPKLLASSKDIAKAVDLLQGACSLDARQVVDSVVLGAGNDHVVFVVAWKGLVQKDVEACLDKVSQAQDHKPLVIDKDKAGNVVKYGLGGADAYVRWLAKDTVAFTDATDDKELLGKLTAGGVAGDKVMKAALGAVKSDALLWVVANKSQDLEDVHAKLSQIYGSADLKSGNVGLDVHLVVESAKSATAAAVIANDRLAELKKGGANAPPAFDPLVKALAIKAAGSELVVTASLTEADMLALLSSVLGLLGH
jgi:hypothetical protein